MMPNVKAPFRRLFAVLLLLAAVAFTSTAFAQLGGSGTIEGTVTDSTGAAVPGATVSALELSTGVETTRVTTSSGQYTLAPLANGDYTITITAPGFEKLVHQNVALNGLQVIGLDLKLQVGQANATVTVTEAPPPLETTNAALGGAIDNEQYANIPLEMGNLGAADQRRATDVAFLVVGVSTALTTNNATDEPFLINGNPNSTQMHVDGLPLSSPQVLGDPRYIWTAIPAESIEQFQVKTTGYSAEYGGLGLENFTVKSGTNQIHGTLYSIARNTFFDASGFIPVVNKVTGAQIKTPEHQWENGMNVGGPILRDKLFLFLSYMDYRDSTIALPNYETIPTAAELCGDFSAADAGGTYPIYDPTTQTSGTSPTRTQFSGASYTSAGCGTGPVTANVIPQAEISPQSKYLQQYWNGVTYANANSVNNYIGTYSNGLANWSTANRVDWTISSRQSANLLVALGRQSTVNGSSQTTNDGPLPYRDSKAFNPRTAIIILSHTFNITSNLVNQFSGGLAEYHSNTFNLGLNTLSAGSAGITNTPVGQTTNSFPELLWPSSGASANDAPSQWGGGAGSGGSSSTSSNTTSFKDNLLWLHGKHSITVGAQLQFLGFHDIPSWGASSPLTLDFAAAQTGQFSTGTTINPATGLPLASFLLGAVNTGSYTQYAPQYLETRSYTHQMAFYVNDDYRVTSKLTANVGLRWDIITPMQEAANHFSFLNATMTNPVTGTPGALQFAGNGTDSCNCSTPANTYYKNFGPRLGAAYALNDKTVIRASYGMYYGLTNGGTGSSGVSASGLQSGYSAAPSVISPGVSAPAFYLNNSGYNASLNNSAFGGPGYSVTAPPIVDPRYGTFYSTAAVAPYNVSTTLGYIDPYYGNRVPQFTEWSLGFQRLLTRDITATVSYVGNQAHFLYNGAARGYYNDQMDPKYLTLGSNLTNTSTSANIATAGLTAPYSTYPTSGATIQQMLQPFPQYKGTSDLYGEVANANYNALQISVTGRKWRGLNFLVNYTYSKSIDDDGTFRSGYAIPAGLVANSSQGWAIDRIERSYSVTDTPHNLTAYATYDLPFGKGHIGGGNAIVSNIIGGWSFSSIYTYISGLPLALTGTCKITLGTCEPTYNPAFSGNPMPNGKWGQGATAASLATTQYISPTAFVNTSTLTNPYVIGNVARTAPLKLRGAANYNIDSTLKRTFNIYGQGRVKFVFEASAFNTTNHVWFGSPGSNDAGGASIGTTVGSSTLGTVTKQANNPRQLQFAGHINF